MNHAPINPHGSPLSRAEALSRKRVAFTLIELLVVISIIGVLASLTVGLTKLATRKSNEARIKTEMTRLINEIENYKSTLGSYPPDHANPNQTAGIPAPNQLYYELSGTVFDGFRYTVPGRSDFIAHNQIMPWFGVSGFANAARSGKDLKFTTEFKANQYHRIDNPPIDILTVPVKGPANRIFKAGSIYVNPWLYVSTSPTNNPDRFDLWTEVIIGGKVIRFSNWERDPVVIQ
jgi:prepilin-type N-terminal cleavage/methylation domain-containing protein